MADKMMRVAGRDVASGNSKGLSVVSDGEGNGVLRMVDSAPYLAEIAEYATPTHAAVNVTVTSTLLLAQNTLRKYARFVNNSNDTIYICEGEAATTSKGFFLLGKGSSYEMSALCGNLYKGNIYAIHAATGTKQVLVTEGV